MGVIRDLHNQCPFKRAARVGVGLYNDPGWCVRPIYSVAARSLSQEQSHRGKIRRWTRRAVLIGFKMWIKGVPRHIARPANDNIPARIRDAVNEWLDTRKNRKRLAYRSGLTMEMFNYWTRKIKSFRAEPYQLDLFDK